MKKGVNYEKLGIMQTFKQTFSFDKKEKGIFDGIVGYDGIKKILNLALIAENTIAICLAGPPATGKSRIVKCIEKHYGDHAVWFDCGRKMITAAGFRDFMYANKNMKILILDELSRMSPYDQEILLNLIMEGTITNTKSMAGYRKESFKGLKIFATSNNPEKLIDPLKSRLDIYYLPPYTLEQFTTIGIQNYEKFEDKETLLHAINAVWYRMKSKDLRDLDKLMSYAIADKVDLEEIIQTKLEFSRPKPKQKELVE